MNQRDQIMFLPVLLGKKKKSEYRAQETFLLELIKELIGNHISCKRLVGLNLLWVVFIILSSIKLQCIISLQNVYPVVHQVQENTLNMGVINGVCYYQCFENTTLQKFVMLLSTMCLYDCKSLFNSIIADLK